MLGAFTSIRATQSPLKSRRAMLDTLLKHLDMVRLSVGLAGLVLTLGLMGCTGLISGDGGGGGSPEEQAAIDDWVTLAYPALQTGSCTSCHSAGTGGAPMFLAGDKQLDVRTTLLGFMPSILDFDTPASSQILTKGVHEGPALSTDGFSAVVTWIQAEADAAGSGSGSASADITTNPFQFQLCTSGVAGDPTCPINTVDISALPNAPALPNAKITFIAQPLSNDIYVTDLYADAGTSGLYIEHPLFVYIPPTGSMCSNGEAPPCPDDIDRFSDVKLDMMPTDPPTHIGDGIAAFTGFAPVTGAQLQIAFKVVDMYRPASGGTTTNTGCKVMTGTNGFYTTVTTVMNAKVGAGLTPGAMYCEQCHSSSGASKNMNAMAAMDISGIEGCATDTSATSTCATACGQILGQINFQSIPTSGIILAPESGQDAAHPEKFSSTTDFNTFKTALVNWATAENSAQ